MCKFDDYFGKSSYEDFTSLQPQTKLLKLAHDFTSFSFFLADSCLLEIASSQTYSYIFQLPPMKQFLGSKSQDCSQLQILYEHDSYFISRGLINLPDNQSKIIKTCLFYWLIRYIQYLQSFHYICVMLLNTIFLELRIV